VKEYVQVIFIVKSKDSQTLSVFYDDEQFRYPIWESLSI